MKLEFSISATTRLPREGETDGVNYYFLTVEQFKEAINENKLVEYEEVYDGCFYGTFRSEIEHKLGSIIRIHRGDTRKYNKSFQLNCDSGIKGAWTIFDPSETYSPTDQSGRTYTFTDDDKKKLKEIRKFGEKFLKDNNSAEFSSIGANDDEEDIIGLVVTRQSANKLLDKFTIFNGEEFYKIEIPKDRYNFIAMHDTVRVRGIKVKKGSDYVSSDYSNIMKLDKDHAAAKELKKKVEKAKKDKKINEKLDFSLPETEKSKTISEILGKKLKISTLKNLMNLDSNKTKGQKYRVNVNVVEVGPREPKNWILRVDSKTRKQYKLDDSIKVYYKLQLFCKDAIAEDDHDIYTLYYCSIEGKRQEFLL